MGSYGLGATFRRRVRRSPEATCRRAGRQDDGHSLGVITPEHAAEMSAAAAADAASSVVMHTQPTWIAALFCPKFAVQIMAELNSLNLGAKVTSP